MADQQASLNGLLQWGIKNSATAKPDSSTSTSHDATQGLNSKMLADLLGGPSDADLMRESMAAILAPFDHVNLENKLIAFDNFEQLIEQIDNANNMEPMGLWPPLLRQLESAEAEIRRMAAWCCITAVQNNIKSQEYMLAHGGVEVLARVAVEDPAQAVRKKAISALSSEVRNYQAGLDRLESSLPETVWTKRKTAIDASDMEAVDEMIQTLRDHSANRA